MTQLPNLCGCGNPVKYITPGPNEIQLGSCNKYARCPTYQELKEIIKQQQELLLESKKLLIIITATQEIQTKATELKVKIEKLTKI